MQPIARAASALVNGAHGAGALLGALLLALFTSACGDPGAVVPGAPAVVLSTKAERTANQVVARTYIVTFRGSPGDTHRAFASFAAEAQRGYALLAEPVTSDARVKDLRYITTVDLANPKDPERVRALDPPRALRLAWGAADATEIPGAIAQVEFTSDAEAASALAEWEEKKLLWFAEPDHQSKVEQQPFTPALVQTYTTMKIWWHDTIRLVDAYNYLTAHNINPSNPVIAVMDSGVDQMNGALTPQIWNNPAVGKADCGADVFGCNATAATKDTFGDGNVYPFGTSGYGQPCPEDAKSESCGHGTHVAGIIAATPDGSGIGGVCPFCRIMIVKIIKDGLAADSAILNGFKYLTRFKQVSTGDDLVRIANASIGTYARSRAIALLVTVLSRSPNNVLVVAAAGNEDSMIRSYPAGYPEALAVAAIGQDDGKATYSNFGPWISIAAPGGDSARSLPKVRSTVPGTSGKGEKQGTSMASPVVAGVAGLVLAADPTRSTAALKASLLQTADPRLYFPDPANPADYKVNNLNYYDPAFAGEGRTPLLGSGVVDAAAAIENVRRTGYGLTANDTVTRGCGTLPSPHAGAPLGLLLLVAAPVLAASGARARARGSRDRAGGLAP